MANDQFGKPDVPDGTGRDRLLAAAVEVLNTQGASALRISDIVERAGVSLGLVSHHFGGREGLVAAAQQLRFEGAVRADLQAIDQLLRRIRGVHELRAELRKMTEMVVDPSRSTIRLGRVAAIATAHGEPAGSDGASAREVHFDARELLGKTTTNLLDIMSTFVEDMQIRGLVRADLHPRAVATIVQAYAFGMVLADLDARRADTQAYVDLVDRLLSTILVLDNDS